MAKKQRRTSMYILQFLRIIVLLLACGLEYIFVRDSVIYGALGEIAQTILFVGLSILFCWGILWQTDVFLKGFEGK
ncbi:MULTISPECIES: hypothetical protein [unclassified Enterococcus]|jgi:hypothetical protein|uniref:hypothetical protein n=1 Tax=unclassified Enterococcus TaxID=2608891 RepID=UPI003D28F3CF